MLLGASNQNSARDRAAKLAEEGRHLQDKGKRLRFRAKRAHGGAK